MALAAVWDAIRSYIPAMVSFLAGMSYQSGHEAKNALKDAQDALAAGHSVDGMSDDAVDKELQSLGAMRRVDGK